MPSLCHQHCTPPKWRARVKRDYREIKLGCFVTFDEAKAVEDVARERYGITPSRLTKRWGIRAAGRT